MEEVSENARECCAVCRQELTPRELEVCLAASQRFNGLLLCFEHQRRFSACPAVRNSPGR